MVDELDVEAAVRIERTSSRWPTWPRWVVVIVAVWLAMIGLVQLLSWLSGQPTPGLCMFHRLTGHPCPTCGTTRLFLAIGQGDLLKAMAFNPLVFVATVLLVGAVLLRVIFERRVVVITSRRSRIFWTVAVLIALVANWTYLWLHLD